jgi:hypothetical protein
MNNARRKKELELNNHPQIKSRHDFDAQGLISSVPNRVDFAQAGKVLSHSSDPTVNKKQQKTFQQLMVQKGYVDDNSFSEKQYDKPWLNNLKPETVQKIGKRAIEQEKSFRRQF